MLENPTKRTEGMLENPTKRTEGMYPLRLPSYRFYS
jgi:hypothetical protein